MNQDEQAHLDVGTRTQMFCEKTDNKTKLDTIDEFADWKAKLDLVLTEMGLAAKTQEEDNKGLVKDKGSLSDILIGSMMKFSLRSKIFAKGLNDQKLLDGLSHPESYYVGSGDDLISKSTAVKELMKDNLTKLTVLKAADITEMETNISNFKKFKELPTTTKQQKKSEGTDLMTPLQARLDDIMESIGDLIHSYFPETVMASNFDLTSKLIKHGRHNVLEVHFVDEAGNPIPGGEINDENSDKTAKADEYHIATIVGVKTGKGKFIATVPGMVDQPINVKIKRSTTTIVIVKMVKAK